MSCFRERNSSQAERARKEAGLRARLRPRARTAQRTVPCHFPADRLYRCRGESTEPAGESRGRATSSQLFLHREKRGRVNEHAVINAIELAQSIHNGQRLHDHVTPFGLNIMGGFLCSHSRHSSCIIRRCKSNVQFGFPVSNLGTRDASVGLQCKPQSKIQNRESKIRSRGVCMSGLSRIGGRFSAVGLAVALALAIGCDAGEGTPNARTVQPSPKMIPGGSSSQRARRPQGHEKRHQSTGNHRAQRALLRQWRAVNSEGRTC